MGAKLVAINWRMSFFRGVLDCFPLSLIGFCIGLLFISIFLEAIFVADWVIVANALGEGFSTDLYELHSF